METIEDEILFRNAVAACPKEELIDLIVNHACRNYEFEVYVREWINHSDDAEEILQGFLKNYIETIDDPSTASVFTLSEGGDMFLEKMKSSADTVSKARAYLTVINELDRLLGNGIGWYDDDDFIVVDFAKDCMKCLSEMAKSAAQSDDEQYAADFKSFVFSSELSNGVVGLEMEWDMIHDLFRE